MESQKMQIHLVRFGILNRKIAGDIQQNTEEVITKTDL